MNRLGFQWFADFYQAYLKALYAMPADEFGTLQRQAIVSGVSRSMKAAAAP